MSSNNQLSVPLDDYQLICMLQSFPGFRHLGSAVPAAAMYDSVKIHDAACNHQNID